MIDIGVNLTNTAFRDDLPQVLARARGAGVRSMVVTGTSVAGSEAAAALAGEHPGVLWSTAGIHPHDAKTGEETSLPALRTLLGRKGVVAVGECGLDYDRDYSPRPVQDHWFEAQVALAAETGRPLFLHERAAHGRLVEILRPWRDRVVGAVIHCFTGTGDELRRYLDMDLHIGVTGWICDERRGTLLQDLVRLIPKDRLMVETDAPYLLPRDLRPRPKSRRNEPCYLRHVV
jgi:TatD DNase family protein